MSKTRQVMTLDFHGVYYVCIVDNTTNCNPYKLYKKWYDQGWHRKKIVEYQDLDSVIFHIMQERHPVVSWDVR